MFMRCNSELANDYGNLAQRVLSMIARNCDGAVPSPGALEHDDEKLLGEARGLLPALRELMDAQLFHEALERIWMVIRAANVYVDRQAPWALRKSDPARMGTVLFVLAETIRHIAVYTLPFMPASSDRILDQLAITPDQRGFASVGAQGALKPGTQLPQPTGVFPRLAEEAPA